MTASNFLREGHSTRRHVGWLIIVLGCIAFYILSAWAFYQMLVTNPFFGSTLQPEVQNMAAVQAGLHKWGLSLERYALINVLTQTLITVTCCLLAALIFWRRPMERAAWIMSLLLAALGTLVPSQAAAVAQLYPQFGFIGLLVNQLGSLTIFALLLVFPDARFVPRWTRWTLVAFAVFGLIGTVFSIRANALATMLFVGAALSLFLLAFFAQVYRYLYVSGPVERQQTKWVVAALVAGPLFWVIGAFVIPMLIPAVTQTGENAAPYNLVRWSLNNLGTLLVPLAIGLSILRYRLWEIDVIIRRTVTYTIVVAVLLVLYFGSVILLQQLFASVTGQRSEIITIVSTLAIAALFVPLRNRVQNAIDKRFNRKKYDAQQVLQKFAQTVRDETDLDKLNAELLNVVNETMQPKNASVWLKKQK